MRDDDWVIHSWCYHQRKIYQIITTSSRLVHMICSISIKQKNYTAVIFQYNVIFQRPVDIQKIRTRIRKETYRSLEDLESDVMLMCANTQRYNIDGSLVSTWTLELYISQKNIFRSSKIVSFFNQSLRQRNKCCKRVASFQMQQL